MYEGKSVIEIRESCSFLGESRSFVDFFFFPFQWGGSEEIIVRRHDSSLKLKTKKKKKKHVVLLNSKPGRGAVLSHLFINGGRSWTWVKFWWPGTSLVFLTFRWVCVWQQQPQEWSLCSLGFRSKTAFHHRESPGPSASGPWWSEYSLTVPGEIVTTPLVTRAHPPPFNSGPF